MTGPEHYQEAQRLIEMASENQTDVDAPYAYEHYLLSKAQAHATLALAAATAATIPDTDEYENINTSWYEADAW